MISTYSQHQPSPSAADKHLSNRGGPDSPDRTNLSRCSFSRNWLLHVATETMEVANRGYYVNNKGDTVNVSQALEYAKQNSIHYHYQDEFHLQPESTTSSTLETYDTRVSVVYGTSLQVAAKLRNLQGDIGVLNSASARNPGEKFYRGTVSQEDCICRASLLHPCLLQFKDLPDHYVSINSNFPEGTSSACAIYAPKVPVYRVDSERCPVLDEPQLCSFLSMPAPNAFEVATQLVEQEQQQQKEKQGATKLTDSPTSVTNCFVDEQFQQLIDRIYERLVRVLCIFHENNCRHLVLCAFGCGVHGNDPSMVAEIFCSLLNGRFKSKFETVVFSIQPSRTYNFDAFVKVFSSAQTSIPQAWSTRME
ncbi:hypothetical protein MPSEU_000944100 [Mayamaea pseudoterrestris]|nr:hypothetical protein MPSEU_000944100 [Mayamaea pseudoterrestris]